MKIPSLAPTCLALALAFSSSSYGEAPPASVMTKARQEAMTPQDALLRLKEGNDRFVAGKPNTVDLAGKDWAAD